MTLEESGIITKEGLVITTANDEPSFDGNVAIFFDYLSEESNTVEASITDNWVESNYSRQDHIAVKPRVYRLKGYVGEVIFKQPTKWVKELSAWANSADPILVATRKAIKPINAISGIASNYTQAAINVVNQLESSFNRYKQIYEAFKNQNQEYVGRRQKVVSSVLLNLLETRTPVKLTDLTFQDVKEIKGRGERLYFLQSVSARQGDNAFITDIEVTIKEFRIAQTKVTEADPKKFVDPTLEVAKAPNGTGDTKQITTTEQTKQVLEKSKEEFEKSMSQYANNKTPKNYLNMTRKFVKMGGNWAAKQFSDTGRILRGWYETGEMNYYYQP